MIHFNLKTMKEKFEQILELIDNVDIKVLSKSMDNVHAKGLFSLVIDGSEFGKLTRVFIAKKKIKPFDVQLHTHCYPLTLTVIKGGVKHHIANETFVKSKRTASKISKFQYQSPLNKGKGLEYNEHTYINVRDHILPIGCSTHLEIDDIHTVSCSKGSIWMVEEEGFKINTSKVLGVPFVVNKLYTTPKSYQINDNLQLLRGEIKLILNEYIKL